MTIPCFSDLVDILPTFEFSPVLSFSLLISNICGSTVNSGMRSLLVERKWLSRTLCMIQDPQTRKEQKVSSKLLYQSWRFVQAGSPFYISPIFDDDKGLPNVLELQDANAYHLNISNITPMAWRGHLDNQLDVEFLDLHDHCYATQAVMENAVNRRAQELLKAKCEATLVDFDNNPAMKVLPEKIDALLIEVKEHKASLDRMLQESKKWASHQVSLLILESKVASLEAEKVDLTNVKGYRPSYKQKHTKAGNEFATAT
ncbi:hypothetical protein Tco_1399435, partial [Tanacetum coccineum]